MARIDLLDAGGDGEYGFSQRRRSLPTQGPLGPSQPIDGMPSITGGMARQPKVTAGPVGAAPLGGSPTPFDVNAFGQGWLTSGGKTNQDWLNYFTGHPEAAQAGYSIQAGPKPGELLGPNGTGWDTVIASGEGGRGASWSPFGGSASAGGNVFSDPATAQWEAQLRQLSDRLNQPVNTADYAPLVDYLRKYFGELQGPAYTPGQSDLLQTQAIDPLTRQRDAARQQATERFAARGIDPKSGIAEKALQDIDRQYSQLATQQHSQFATNAINLEKQQHQMAGGVGNALQQLEQAKTLGDEQRALQSLQLMGQIPQLADRRLATAQQALQPVNPMQALGMYPQFGQLGLQQYGQDQNFLTMIGQALAQAFGGGYGG